MAAGSLTCPTCGTVLPTPIGSACPICGATIPTELRWAMQTAASLPGTVSETLAANAQQTASPTIPSTPQDNHQASVTAPAGTLAMPAPGSAQPALSPPTRTQVDEALHTAPSVWPGSAPTHRAAPPIPSVVPPPIVSPRIVTYALPATGYRDVTKTSSKQTYSVGLWFIVGLMLLSLGASLIYITSQRKHTSNTTAGSSSEQVTTLPTSTPMNQLYAADWSIGLDGWTGGPQWSAANGMLTSDGSTRAGSGQAHYMELAPFSPSTPNYVVQVQIQLTGCTDSTYGCSFGLLLHTSQSGKGYEGEELQVDLSGTIASAGIARYDENGDEHITFLSAQQVGNTESGWYPYRLQYSSGTISFYINNDMIASQTDSTYAEPGQVGLSDYGAQLNVRDFQVVALA